MNKKRGASRFSRKSRGFQAGLVFVCLIVFFWVIQLLAPHLSGNDSYFHIKYAWLIWQEGAIWDFPWLQGTLFKTTWVDHQFLYHLLLIPFTWFDDLYLSALGAGIFWAALALFTVYIVIRRLDTPDSAWFRYAWIWALVLAASSNTMLYRLGQTRIQAVSLIFMMVAIILMEKGKNRFLLPLGFFYAWLYHGSVILIPLTLLYSLSGLVVEKKWDWKPVAWAISGLGLGFIINPYFPQDIVFLYKHVIQFAGGESSVPLSAEWLNYPSWTLFQTTQGAWLVLFLGILTLAFSDRPISKRTLFWFLANSMMLILFFKARRFVEYWPPLAVVFFASAVFDHRDQWVSRFSKLTSDNRQGLTSRAYKAVLAGILTALFLSAGVRAYKTVQEIKEDAPPDRFTAASSWLKSHTSRQTIVFNEQWDNFPDLFFNNHHNLWVTGLNLNFTYLLDPRLYRLYKNITYGNVADTARYLKREFGAQYALTLKEQGGLVRLATDPDNGLQLVWEDKTSAIYKLEPSDRQVQMKAELYPYRIVKAEEPVTCQTLEPGRSYNNRPSPAGLLECKTAGGFAEIFWQIEIPREGTWKMEGQFPRTPNAATAQVFLNGKQQGPPLDLYGKGKQVGPLQDLGMRHLPAGPLDLAIRYNLPSGGGENIFGLDRLKFSRADHP
ncbi:MAG: hypothetical protein HY787_18035 [Deltaproteobacteria bacterium]|nr:hypothetical protein [Deltaproteobacteria bacterium]